MRLFKKQLFILTTIFTLVASFVLPYLPQASAAENYITVEQAIANNSGTATVKGYIVGYTTAANKYQQTAPFSGNTNIAIADSPTETDPAKIMPVRLPTGEIRTNFNLQTNPNNLGKVVYIKGTLGAYFTVPGITTVTEMSFNQLTEEPTDPVTPTDPPTDGVKINAIQGEGHDSPLKGQTVTGVVGVVTFVKDANNFYMQDPNPDNNSNTSEGILVYKKSHNVKVGDLISVDGLVKEWVLEGYSDMLNTDLTTTELDANSGKIAVHASNQELPKALVIGKDINPPTQVVDNDQFKEFDPKEDGIDFWESIEGMRVAIDNPIAIAPQRYGEVPVISPTSKVDGKPYTTPGGIAITKDNMNPERLPLLFTTKDENYKVKTGDYYDGTVTGVITYTFQNYKLLTNKSELPTLVESDYQQETTNIVNNDDKLTVASYNMENYTKADTAKTAKIAESIVNNLKTPDIVGLVEVQDNNGETAGGTAADQNYQALIDAIKQAGGPTYKWTDIEPVNNQDGGAPNGNIRVGYIYNPDRVALKEGAKKGGSTETVGYENGSLTLNPGRIDPTNEAFNSSRKPLAAEFTFKGKDVIVIANHFNSKGGDFPIFGKVQPPTLDSEVQRLKIAEVVNTFIKNVKSKNADANIVVLGDLNDFEFSNPLIKLKGDELTNLIEKVPVPDRFTYTYQGNSQVLDHMLVSNNLANRSEIDIVHLNAPFTPMHGRVSDHDPVLAQINLNDEVTPPGPKAIDLTIMHVNDTHANVEKYPKLTTAVNEVRAEKPDALLVDAGDVFSGTLYFNKYLGKADLEFMNKLGYDAMTFGNHEFDKDSNILADFIKDMKFPMLSANVNVTKDPVLSQLFKDEINAAPEGGNIYPAIVKEIDGEKVGLFGLTTEDTTYLANPSKDIVFENAVDKAKETVAALKEKGINKIVVLSHLGYGPDQQLAKAVDGIDVIVGGHSHTKLVKPEVIDKPEPTVIVQANEYLNYLGVLNVSFDENGVVTKQDGQLLETATYKDDAEAAARVDELKKPLDELKQTVIGSSKVNLDGERSNVRYKETNLGNLVTDSMAQKASEILKKDVTIAMQNGGGIRASIPQGDVTLGHIHTVMPFANLLVTLDLTGQEIWDALEHSVSKAESGAGQFMQVSGLKFKYDKTRDAYNRVWEVQVKTADGYEPIDLAKTYTVATNAFVADGGDGFTMFKKAKDAGRINELLLVDYEILTDYFQKNSPVEPYVEGRIITPGWGEQYGKKVFYNEEGEKLTGWQLLKGEKYYFNQDGFMQTGVVEISNKLYYFDSEGIMQTGWQIVDNKKYFFDLDGVARLGWQVINKKVYYFNADGVMQAGWQMINNNKYYFNAEGELQTGWQTIDGKKYYLGISGAMRTGWQIVDKKKYYFGTDGAMSIGWQTIEGNKYYFDKAGVIKTGWQTIDGKKYYLGISGAVRVGWQIVNNKVYYFGSDGVTRTGFQKISSKTYYFGTDGAMRTKWQTINKKKYYFSTDGVMRTTWKTIKGNKYYFDKNGVMQTGWEKINSKKYYFDKNGVMQTGWEKINSKKYYFDKNGVMQTGWEKIGSKKYYFDKNGVMQTGWEKIGSKKYYFDKNGVMQTGWEKIGSKKYYFDKNGVMQTGWEKIGSKKYYFDKNGVMQTGWEKIGSKKYYFDKNGVMQTGWKKINGKWYYFGKDGALR
ncbi:5'-nucleotidase C-terminal domain-containing protein [Bacillus rubiinfantis]|uniref:5'-nucleotidase C-terminal domain-containing protein n=1 Tax=Bacillus rubiinfantis TaxID=1499680 RepID=UPI0009E4BF03|nr:5'-nucleotidase C-terminal domain-containing protein [Bacillus rubiinfantis]